MNQQPFTILPASWRDLGAIRHIEQVCFPHDAWPLFDLIGALTLPNLVRLKAVVETNGEEQTVGLIIGDIKKGEGLSWIATIGVLPEYRGRGIGSALLQACEALLPTAHVRLNVRISNQGAIQLYQKLGYKRVGLWAGYYVDKEDALVMEKDL